MGECLGPTRGWKHSDCYAAEQGIISITIRPFSTIISIGHYCNNCKYFVIFKSYFLIELLTIFQSFIQ